MNMDDLRARAIEIQDKYDRTSHSRLIIIRGNSGSGKSMVAKRVRAALGDGLSDNTMLVQQDTFRRDILRERDRLDRHATIELIELVVKFGRTQGRTVILEGVFGKQKYGSMLKRLIDACDKAHVYYFDLPFEETLRRHATKPNVHEFGENEMREWRKAADYLDAKMKYRSSQMKLKMR